MIIVRQSGGPSNLQWELSLRRNERDELVLCGATASIDPGNPVVIEGTNAIPLNEWTHVAMTASFDTGLRLYENGRLDSSTGNNSYWPQMGYYDAVWCLGASQGIPFFGRIDEFSIYCEALPAEEVRQIHDAESPGVPLPPQVISFPRYAYAGIGGHVTMSAAVANPGAAAFDNQWQFNTTNLPGATNAQLVLEDLLPSQSGRYRLLIHNSAGAATTSELYLAIAGVVAWGQQISSKSLEVPQDLTNVLAISASWDQSVAVLADGSVRTWGTRQPFGLPAGLSGIRAVALGGGCSLALRADGTVLGWGNSQSAGVRVPGDLTNAVAISAGFFGMALRADGTVVTWGGSYEQAPPVPSDVTNIVAIAAGPRYFLALRADGHVLASGQADYGQTDVPKDLTNAVAVAANIFQSLALRSDGTVVAWGKGAGNWDCLATVPQGADRRGSDFCRRGL